MREIKFRVWDKVTKQMLTGFHLFGEITLVGGIHAWQAEEAEVLGVKRDTLGALNDLVEMQYTGVKDRDGNEIYEGDIVVAEIETRKYSPVTVQWEESGFNLSSSPSYTILGNIYENTEQNR